MERERLIEVEVGKEASSLNNIAVTGEPMPSDKQSTTTTPLTKPIVEERQAAEVRQKWGEIVEDVSRGKKRVIVERYGRPVAAIVSVEELARLDELERDLAEPFRKLSDVQGALGEFLPGELNGLTQVVERIRQELERLQRLAV